MSRYVFAMFFVLGIIGSMTSCKKEVGSNYVEPLSGAELLEAGNCWIMVDAQYKVNNGDWINNFASIPDCVKDNELSFPTDDRYELVEGALKCNVTDPERIGKGRFDLIEREIKILYTDTIIVVNDPDPNDTTYIYREEMYSSLSANRFVFINIDTNTNGDIITSERIWAPKN